MDEATRASKAEASLTTVTRSEGRGGFTLEEGTRGGPRHLIDLYSAILDTPQLDWTEGHRLIRILGAGGQGTVFLTERLGSDGFRLPVALKVFSPERYGDDYRYEEVMARMMRVARIQQDHLLDVHNFVAPGGVRVMEIVWIDGHDLGRLLTPEMLGRARWRVDDRRWAYLNDLIVTAGAARPRLRPKIAIAVLRDCLAALSALHRDGVVHGDVRPSNIMLKRTGTAKLVDVGAAFHVADAPPRVTCTPSYAAPEVLAGLGGLGAVGPGQPGLRPDRRRRPGRGAVPGEAPTALHRPGDIPARGRSSQVHDGHRRARDIQEHRPAGREPESNPVHPHPNRTTIGREAAGRDRACPCVIG